MDKYFLIIIGLIILAIVVILYVRISEKKLADNTAELETGDKDGSDFTFE